MANYEAQVDELPLPRRAEHKVCSDCSTEHFEKKCPNCAERDRLADATSQKEGPKLRQEQWVHIPQGTKTYAGPWSDPDWTNLSAEGDFRVSYLDERDSRLTWACIDLSSTQITWVKVGAWFGVSLFKKHTRA